jgi:Asp/Glu/hydantoin racemase
MKPRILVINPNSNESVTSGMDRALQSCREKFAVDIFCRTLADGPFGIETDEDIASVVPLVVDEIRGNDAADAFIIACYSDPGLEESRVVALHPVFGIQESAVSLSATYGRRFGVLALGRESIQRHIAYVRQLGCQEFHAGERPLNVSVEGTVSDPHILQKIIDTGRQLVEEDGAETLILGCAGLAQHRQAAQLELGVPLIDPVEAAVTMAAESLGYS